MSHIINPEALRVPTVGARAKRGELYLQGNGVAKDYQKAFQHLSKGCKQGLSKACISLGYMHEYGQGVPLDLDKALDSYSRACESKNGMGCYRLAELHISNKAAKSSPPVAMGLFSQKELLNSLDKADRRIKREQKTKQNKPNT